MSSLLDRARAFLGTLEVGLEPPPERLAHATLRDPAILKDLLESGDVAAIGYLLHGIYRQHGPIGLHLLPAPSEPTGRPGPESPGPPETAKVRPLPDDAGTPERREAILACVELHTRSLWIMGTFTPEQCEWQASEARGCEVLLVPYDIRYAPLAIYTAGGVYCAATQRRGEVHLGTSAARWVSTWLPLPLAPGTLAVQDLICLLGDRLYDCVQAALQPEYTIPIDGHALSILGEQAPGNVAFLAALIGAPLNDLRVITSLGPVQPWSRVLVAWDATFSE